jgi:hypothetical protein
MPNINLSPYTAESQAIAQRMKMAELLGQQAMQPIEVPQQAGVKFSPYQGLAKLLQGYTSGMLQKKGLEQQQALAEKYQAGNQADIANFLGAMQGTPQKELAGPAPEGAPTGVSPEGMQGGYIQPAQAPDRQRAMALALGSQNPTLQGAGGAMLSSMMTPKSPIQVAAGGTVLDPTTMQPIYTAPKDRSPINVAAGGTVLNPTTGEVIFTAPRERTGELGVYDEYVKQQKAAGKQPMSIDQFQIEQRKASRNVTVNPRERMQFDPVRGGVVNLDTGEFKPVVSPTGEPIGSREKPLTSGEVNKITDIDTSLGAQKRLKETFDDKYAGYKLQMGGELANVIGSKFGGDNQAQAEWWASHAANDNIARNALFGASLTAGEQKAWEKTSINPGMSPSMIRNRMAEREALIDAKRNTTVENLGKAGYDVKGFKDKPDFYNPSVNTPPVSALKEGQTTTFANGQKWTLQGGKPVQVK